MTMEESIPLKTCQTFEHVGTFLCMGLVSTSLQLQLLAAPPWLLPVLVWLSACAQLPGTQEGVLGSPLACQAVALETGFLTLLCVHVGRGRALSRSADLQGSWNRIVTGEAVVVQAGALKGRDMRSSGAHSFVVEMEVQWWEVNSRRRQGRVPEGRGVYSLRYAGSGSQTTDLLKTEGQTPSAPSIPVLLSTQPLLVTPQS